MVAAVVGQGRGMARGPHVLQRGCVEDLVSIRIFLISTKSLHHLKLMVEFSILILKVHALVPGNGLEHGLRQSLGDAKLGRQVVASATF